MLVPVLTFLIRHPALLALLPHSLNRITQISAQTKADRTKGQKPPLKAISKALRMLKPCWTPTIRRWRSFLPT